MNAIGKRTSLKSRALLDNSTDLSPCHPVAFRIPLTTTKKIALSAGKFPQVFVMFYNYMTYKYEL